MHYRTLGTTGISISSLAFGAGPVSGLLTGTSRELQRAVVAKALELGINWFDTSATYGKGASEEHLGLILDELRSHSPRPLHIATKVRLILSTETDLRPLVMKSVCESLGRLRVPRVTLLQIHNSVTRNRNDLPTSITPEDILGSKGILEGMQEARAAGLVDHFGMTGIGDADALTSVMNSQQFATIQAPFHLFNPSALRPAPATLCDPNYEGFLRVAYDLGMGIFAIRVFAGGALLGAEPSAHTLSTPYFPLELYRRDQARVQKFVSHLDSAETLPEYALRFVLSQPEIFAAIVGFGAVDHVVQAARIAEQQPFTASELAQLTRLIGQ